MGFGGGHISEGPKVLVEMRHTLLGVAQLDSSALEAAFERRKDDARREVPTTACLTLLALLVLFVPHISALTITCFMSLAHMMQVAPNYTDRAAQACLDTTRAKYAELAALIMFFSLQPKITMLATGVTLMFITFPGTIAICKSSDDPNQLQVLGVAAGVSLVALTVVALAAVLSPLTAFVVFGSAMAIRHLAYGSYGSDGLELNKGDSTEAEPPESQAGADARAHRQRPAQRNALMLCVVALVVLPPLCRGIACLEGPLTPALLLVNASPAAYTPDTLETGLLDVHAANATAEARASELEKRLAELTESDEVRALREQLAGEKRMAGELRANLDAEREQAQAHARQREERFQQSLDDMKQQNEEQNDEARRTLSDEAYRKLQEQSAGATAALEMVQAEQNRVQQELQDKLKAAEQAAQTKSLEEAQAAQQAVLAVEEQMRMAQQEAARKLEEQAIEMQRKVSEAEEKAAAAQQQIESEETHVEGLKARLTAEFNGGDSARADLEKALSLAEDALEEKRADLKRERKTNDFLMQKLDSLETLKQSVERQNVKLDRIDSKIDTVIHLSSEQRSELARTRRVLMKGLFEATEVMTPTAFVVLKDKLPEPPSAAQKEELLALSLKDDGQGFQVSGDLVTYVEQAKAHLEEGKTWLERVQSFGVGVVEGDAEAVFGSVRAALGDLVTHETMYFYLVDELTGEPVRGNGYPLKITTPSELVPKLLPVMQVGMRAMSLYNGVSGVARMFGAPVPTVPDEWCKGAGKTINMLKQRSSVEAFGVVQDGTMGSDEESKTVRGASLRELQRFLGEMDVDRAFAGLRRIGDAESGVALWTMLDEAQAKQALKQRARDFEHEEAQHPTTDESATITSRRAPAPPPMSEPALECPLTWRPIPCRVAFELDAERLRREASFKVLAAAKAEAAASKAEAEAAKTNAETAEAAAKTAAANANAIAEKAKAAADAADAAANEAGEKHARLHDLPCKVEPPAVPHLEMRLAFDHAEMQSMLRQRDVHRATWIDRLHPYDMYSTLVRWRWPVFVALTHRSEPLASVSYVSKCDDDDRQCTCLAGLQKTYDEIASELHELRVRVEIEAELRAKIARNDFPLLIGVGSLATALLSVLLYYFGRHTVACFGMLAKFFFQKMLPNVFRQLLRLATATKEIMLSLLTAIKKLMQSACTLVQNRSTAFCTSLGNFVKGIGSLLGCWLQAMRRFGHSVQTPVKKAPGRIVEWRKQMATWWAKRQEASRQRAAVREEARAQDLERRERERRERTKAAAEKKAAKEAAAAKAAEAAAAAKAAKETGAAKAAAETAAANKAAAAKAASDKAMAVKAAADAKTAADAKAVADARAAEAKAVVEAKAAADAKAAVDKAAAEKVAAEAAAKAATERRRDQERLERERAAAAAEVARAEAKATADARAAAEAKAASEAKTAADARAAAEARRQNQERMERERTAAVAEAERARMAREVAAAAEAEKARLQQQARHEAAREAESEAARARAAQEAEARRERVRRQSSGRTWRRSKSGRGWSG